MNPYFGNIEEMTLENSFFRQVLFTGKHCQLVVMCLLPGEEIGYEVHDNVDQFFRIELGEAKFVLGENNEEHIIADGEVGIVPAGTKHNIINNSSSEELKLYTIYSPPNHPEGTVHKSKEEAMRAEKDEH